PFCPFFPWHTSHRLAKTAAPSLAVPCPGGSSFPSGPIMKSKPLISSWLRGVPTLYLGDCASPAAGTARIITDARRLSNEHCIVYLPITSHFPGLLTIRMNGALRFFQFLIAEAPVFKQLRACRLNFTQLIRATRLEHRLFAAPSPVKGEPRMR